MIRLERVKKIRIEFSKTKISLELWRLSLKYNHLQKLKKKKIANCLSGSKSVDISE